MKPNSEPFLILGCGYVGQSLCRVLVGNGQRVIGTSRTEDRRGDILAVGAEFALYELDADQPLPHPAPRGVFLLAPPPEEADTCAARLERVASQLHGAPLVVVVSTAIYGTTRGTVTERTHPAPRTERQRRWALMDAAALFLREQGHDVRVVRTPAIYGPGRDFRAQLLTGAAQVIRPAPPTSRIHVDDLAALLARMAEPKGPPILLACDEQPSPTHRVMAEAARLLDVPGPRELSPHEASAHFSEVGLEMRLGGHACHSLVRPYLGVRLRYPTYREGLRACLRGASP
ncbi:MAG: hypothetical protein ACO3JL_02125 [Myxococcota bacterium]